MESSVRYIQLKNAGQKPALCFRGEKIAYAVINDEARVRTVEVSLPDHDKAALVKRLGQNYLPQAFASAMRRVKGSKPITKRAWELIEKGDKLAGDAKLPPDVIDAEQEIKVPVEEGVKSKKVPKKVNEIVGADPLGMVSGLQAIAESKAGKPAKSAIGGPRRLDRTPTPSPIAPLPSKAAPSARKEAGAKPKRGAGVKTLVSILASEAGLAQQPCRVKLRAAGLRAPYDEKNEAACRKALGLPTQGKK